MSIVSTTFVVATTIGKVRFTRNRKGVTCRAVGRPTFTIRQDGKFLEVFHNAHPHHVPVTVRGCDDASYARAYQKGVRAFW